MVFYPPEWVPKLPFDPPDSIPISDFMLNEKYGRYPLAQSKPPFTCGVSGRSYTALQVRKRVEFLARGLAKEFGWQPNHGTGWDKVIGVFSVNTIDTLTLIWATHRLAGISTPANAAYSASELEHQLKTSKAKALFTCLPLLPIALEAARNAGIPKGNICLFDLPKEILGGNAPPSEFKTVNQLIDEGAALPSTFLNELRWEKGEGANRVAFLCYSSGTSGMPKAVMISHCNMIANILQLTAFEKSRFAPGHLDVVLGLLPHSHIYSLAVVCHTNVYRGFGVINLPKFDLQQLLGAIQRFKINTLYLVPPIIIALTKNKDLVKKYDLSSVVGIFTGAAPLGEETARDLQVDHPTWVIRQGYGLTETSTVVCSTSDHDIFLGSSGSILPATECRLVTPEGTEIEGYDQPGELVVRSPSVVLGYLNDDAANKETFRDGWIHTGDEAVVRKSPLGYEHIFIVDRIKELIKVKGMQVAPAELEAHLLTHPFVADCAVIPVPDEAAGEIPKAFVVKSASVSADVIERIVVRDIQKHVEQHKSRYKWLKGGVEFIDVIPKSPSGKILRRLLRDQEREKRRKEGAKL
ncbi:hypothetical protein FGG08_001287 [Glutinoglossum americanum]|uniref:4-coumarate--CoA ligase n=1 Tax=Glutinoglossum americanum TaxID=1670608 RepID=A0A9P8I8N1_9PEZI|nr:hypothetical protein FGG08_001287 [Glutinoglossum americanum]